MENTRVEKVEGGKRGLPCFLVPVFVFLFWFERSLIYVLFYSKTNRHLFGLVPSILSPHVYTSVFHFWLKLRGYFFLSSRSVYQQIVIQPCRGQIVAGPTARQSWTRYTGVTFSIDVEGYDLQETNRAPWVWKKVAGPMGIERCRN